MRPTKTQVHNALQFSGALLNSEYKPKYKSTVRKKNTSCPTEYQEQCALVDWLELKKYRFSHIAQSTYTQSYKQRAMNTKSGVRRGVPDMMVIKGDKLIFIELKRSKKSLSRVSKEQKEWVQELDRIPNVIATVAYGAEDAINFIKKQ